MRKEIDYTQYTKEQIKAARFLATIEGERLTNEQIAEQIGISARQLYRWKKNPKFIELYNHLVESEMDLYLSEVYKHMMKGIRSGSVKWGELYLKTRGKLIDRKEVSNDIDVQITTIEGQTNEDLRRKIIEMEKKSIGTVIDAEVVDVDE